MLNVSEISVQFFRCFAVCLICQFGAMEGAEMNPLPIDSDLSYPFAARRVKVDALIAALIVLPCLLIALLFSAVSNPQIIVGVVECILIAVVAFSFIAISQSEYASMHVLDAVPVWRGNMPCSIEFPHADVVKRVPSKLRVFIVQAWTYARSHASTKRDFTVGCIRGCHSLSCQRLGFGGTTNPDTLILPKAEPRYAMEGQTQ